MPVAMAQSTNQPRPDESAFRTAADITNAAASIFSQGMSAYVNASNNINSSQYEMHMVTLNPLLALEPIEANLISPVFAGCAVLPASAPLLGGNMSCEKAPVQSIKTGYANAVIDIATANIKQLQNYQVEGHDRYNAQGKGCYNNAIRSFNTSLLEREKAVDEKIKFFEQELDKFNFNAKQDLDEIKKRTAQLTGTPEKYLTKDTKLEDELISSLNDPGNLCSSIMSAANFSNAAKNGLEGLLAGVEAVATTPKGSGLTAQGMLDSQASIEAEINRISSRVMSNTQDSSEFQASLDGISFNSNIIGEGNAALTKVIDEYNLDIKTQTEQIQKKLGVTKQSLVSNPLVSSIISGIEEDNIDIDSRLLDFEKQTKQSCITKVIASNFDSPAQLGSRFINPNISKSLREKTDNALAIKIENLFDFSDPSNSYSIEDALDLLKKYESQGGNGNYTMVTGKSMTINGKNYNASTRLHASQLLEMFVDNCKQQYTSSANQDGFSNKDIVNNLKSYSNQVSLLRKTAPSKIQTAIRTQLKSCPEDLSTGSTENSCSNSLDVAQANFCLRTAVKCASNMNLCKQKAQEKVETVRAEQTVYVDNYKGHVTNFKSTLMAELKGMDNFIKQQADILNAKLNEGSLFGITDMVFKLGEEQLLTAADGITEDLALEDPDAYFQMAKEQLLELKSKMAEQRVAYVGNSADDTINYLGQGKLGKMANNYIENYSTQIADWEQMISSCNQKMQQVAKAQQESNEAIKQNNETVAKACDELRAFNAAPECETAGDLMTTVLQASRLANAQPSSNTQVNQLAYQADQQAIQQLGEIRKNCLQKGSSGDEMSDLPRPVNAGGITAQAFCDKDNSTYRDKMGGESVSSCDSYLNELSNYTKPHCTVQEMAEKLKEEGYCKNTQGNAIIKCLSEDVNPVTSNDLSDKSRVLYSDAAEKLSCYTRNKRPNALDEAYESVNILVSGYNNYTASTVTLGESIKVTTCNGGADGLVGLKGGWTDWATDTANELGRALGSTRN